MLNSFYGNAYAGSVFQRAEPRFYNIELDMMGAEEILLMGKTIKAYKLRLDPDLGIFSFINIFLPDAYVWHYAEGQHEWLRYDGLESGIGTPLVDISVRKCTTCEALI